MKWLTRSAFLLLALCVGGLIGAQYERSCRMQTPDLPTRQASASVDMALAVAEKGDVDQASVLMRQAIRRAGHDPDSYFYLWNAVQKSGSPFGRIASPDLLRRDVLSGLDAAMLDSESVDDFGKLYKLRSAILAMTSPVGIEPSAQPGAVNHADVAATKASLLESSPSRSQEPKLSADPVALLRAGLQSLKEGDEDRAEFLTQAALRSQPQYPTSVPGLWKEYKEYLDSLESNTKLAPYDRLARLSAYLDSIDTSLLAYRNMADFQLVWAVRKNVVNEQAKSHAALLAEVASDVSKVTASLKQAASSHASRAEALRLIASQSDQLKPRALIVLATADKGLFAKSASDSLRGMLTEAIAIAARDIDALKKRVEVGAAIDDPKGDPIDPASPEKQWGYFESVSRDSRELAKALEAADLHSWILMATEGKERKGNVKVSREISVPANKDDTGLDAELTRILAALDQLQADVARLQGIRYNLWALRSIYGAESSENWDSVLGRIEVGLLHPTVNALYSITYDALVRRQTDPQVRTRMVQNILNSKKQVLSAF